MTTDNHDHETVGAVRTVLEGTGEIRQLDPFALARSSDPDAELFDIEPPTFTEAEQRLGRAIARDVLAV